MKDEAVSVTNPPNIEDSDDENTFTMTWTSDAKGKVSHFAMENERELITRSELKARQNRHEKLVVMDDVEEAHDEIHRNMKMSESRSRIVEFLAGSGVALAVQGLITSSMANEFNSLQIVIYFVLFAGGIITFF